MRKALLFVCVLALLVTGTNAFAQNLLQNPGFEQGMSGSPLPVPPAPWITSGGATTGANTAIFSMSTTHHGTGSYSFCVTGTTTTRIAGQNGPRQSAILIDASGKTKYTLGAYIYKTTNLRTRIRWQMLDERKNVIENNYSSYDTASTYSWTSISALISVTKPGTKYITFTVNVEIGATGTNTGIVYIDDCTITPTSGGTEFGRLSGQVTYNGLSIPGAAVGVKQGSNAAADAICYTTTDANGNYGPIYIPTGTVKVAAWREGWAPSNDVTITGTSGVESSANLALMETPGINLCWGDGDTRTPLASASTSSEPADSAIDNNLSTSWTSYIPAAGLPSPDQYLAIDLNPYPSDPYIQTMPITGITIYWDYFFAGNYTVEASEYAPGSTTTWTPVYSASATTGGYPAAPDGPFVDPIRFDSPIYARSIRIHCTAWSNYSFYAIREVQVHDSTTSNCGGIYGVVRDSSGNPVDGALVHLGQNTYDAGAYRQIATDSSGFYSFSWYPGVEFITADALGYRNIDTSIGLSSNGSPLRHDFTLPAKTGETSLVPNWNFSEADPSNTTKPRYWTYAEEAPSGQVVFARDTAHNHTPGATTACASLDMRTVTDPDNNGKWAEITSSAFPIKSDGLHAYNVWMWRSGKGQETYNDGHYIQYLATDGTVMAYEPIGYYGWARWDLNWQWWRTDTAYRRYPPAGAAFMQIAKIGVDVGFSGSRIVGETPIQGVDDVVVEEVDLVYPESNSLGDAKQLDPGTRVSLYAKQLTAMGGGVPSGMAYAQEFDRSSGIRLDATGFVAGDTWVGPGDAIDLSGTVETNSEGENFIALDNVVWLADTRFPDELGMNSRAVNQKMSQGLFAKLAGKVTKVDSDSFTISDGSEYPVKVYCDPDPDYFSKPIVDSLVKVRGVISTDGIRNTLLLRDEQVDVWDLSSNYQPIPFQGTVKGLRDYLFIGPFGDGITNQAVQMETDFISQATNGQFTESTILPKLGQSIGGHTWFRHDGLDEVVNFGRLFSGQSLLKRTVYAGVYVWSPVDQYVDLVAGSADGLRIWINGELVVMDDYVTRQANYGQTGASYVHLQPGFNTVLFKVCNGATNGTVNGQSVDYFQLVSQFAVAGTWQLEGWNKSTPMEGLGYTLGWHP